MSNNCWFFHIPAGHPEAKNERGNPRSLMFSLRAFGGSREEAFRVAEKCRDALEQGSTLEEANALREQEASKYDEADDVPLSTLPSFKGPVRLLD